MIIPTENSISFFTSFNSFEESGLISCVASQTFGALKERLIFKFSKSNSGPEKLYLSLPRSLYELPSPDKIISENPYLRSPISKEPLNLLNSDAVLIKSPPM